MQTILQCRICSRDFSVDPYRSGSALYCSSACYGVSQRASRPPCQQCGNPVSGASRKFCSTRCVGLAQTRRINLSCENCGAAFTTPPGRMKYGRGRFCSHGCASAFNSRTGKIGRNLIRKTDGRFPKLARTEIGAKARAQFVQALRLGQIVRPAYCERCRKECVPDGHHSDYSKPLDVQWLCRSCHVSVHHHALDTILMANYGRRAESARD